MKLFDWIKKKDKTDDVVEEIESVDVQSIEEEQQSEEPTEIENNNPVEIDFAVEENVELEEEESETIEDDIQLQDMNELELVAFEPTDEKPTKKGFFAKLLEGLEKTRKNISNGVNQVFSVFTKVDDELFEELEEALIMADIGVEATNKLIDILKTRAKKERVTEVSQIRQMLIDEITKILEDDDEGTFEVKSPTVLLIIGVNGVGKTTTIGKLASNFKSNGLKVTVAAADTFRAAAIDQLEIWCKRSKIDIIKHQENSDPAAVIFDACQSARARKSDILICDTAGRMHNKKNLMEELRKIFKVINKEFPEAKKEVFLVLDSTTGQNAFIQATTFKEIAEITGIVLTKLDSTAKGGIIISIKSELNIPIRFIGVGEGIYDLQPFNAKDFAKALFAE